MTPSFSQLLEQAVNEPGTISKAYGQFHNYSFGNQLLACAQCVQRGVQPGPLATLGRHVRKGERALTLCMPVTIKRKIEDQNENTEQEVFTGLCTRIAGSYSHRPKARRCRSSHSLHGTRIGRGRPSV
jgi:hypothetical protein